MPIYPRHAARQVEEALSDTRVVLLAGPRQAGKTTLAQALAGDGRTFLTLDAGLLAAQRDLSPDRVAADRQQLGALLLTFVLGELLKLAGWSGRRLGFAHFRDKEGREVDIVLEDQAGSVVGVEVKAAATVTAADFRGLRQLAEACGSRFALGLVLHDHDRTVPFGERLFAAPLSSLW